MHFEMLTLFPRMFEAYPRESILGKALERGHISLGVTDIRDFAYDKHRVTDDTPYGGGAGMVMKAEPLVLAIESARQRFKGGRVLVTTPRGKTFSSATAQRLARESSLIIVCGRYEGIDERVFRYVDEEVSLGDFVLTGGELVGLCVLDAVARYRPGVLGNAASAAEESFEEGLLEFPQYTRPVDFRGDRVPSVLQAGDHRRIAAFRRLAALLATRARRPDLFAKLTLSKTDQKLLDQHDADEAGLRAGLKDESIL
jgi:tRNA (guanine37-N1)-methyltransferase